MTTSTSRLPEILTPPEVSIRPIQGTLMASTAILVISSLALGFILATKGSLPHVVSSFTGDALPLTALAGISFIIFTVSVVLFKFKMNEIEAHIKNTQKSQAAAIENARAANSRVNSEPKLESLSDFLSSSPPEADNKPKNKSLTYEEDEMEAIFGEKGRLRTQATARYTVLHQDLFDPKPIVSNASYQKELDDLRESAIYVINKLALFVETFIRADYYIHHGKKRTVQEDHGLVHALQQWDEAIVYVRDQIVNDIFDILRGEKQISSNELLSYFLNFNYNCFFPLAKMITIAVRRMVTAHNFGKPDQCAKTFETREMIEDFFNEMHKGDPKLISLQKLENILVYLTLAPFEHPDDKLREKAEEFFKLLLTENTEFGKKEVIDELAKCKSTPKKGHEFLFLQNLFQIKDHLIKNPPTGANIADISNLKTRQKALKKAFDEFFEVWIVQLMNEIKKESAQFSQVLGVLGFPAINRIIEEDNFEGNKLKAVMALLLHLSSYNCGILKDLKLASEIIEKEIEINFSKETSEQVALIHHDEGATLPVPIFKAQDKAVKIVNEKRVAEKVDKVVIQQKRLVPYFKPFLSVHLRKSTTIQAKGAFTLIDWGVGLIGVDWMIKFVKPLLNPVYNAMLAKKPGNDSWYQNNSPFRKIFSQIAIPANDDLTLFYRRKELDEELLLPCFDKNPVPVDLIHGYVHGYGHSENIPLERMLIVLAHHLTHVKKLFEDAIPK